MEHNQHFYHDVVLLNTAEYLDRTPKFRHTRLTKSLREVALLLRKTEYRIIEGYENNDDVEVFICLRSLKNSLLEKRYESDNDISVYQRTYRYLRKYTRRYENYRPFPDGTYENMPVRCQMVEPKVEGKDKSFKEYYKIVTLLMEDINNLKDWDEIHKHYRDTYNPNDYQNRKMTFLSYAFKDNTYAFYLFHYFLDNGGFLYVDSLLGIDYKGDGKLIKSSLSPWIDNSSQILFLHSVNSDGIIKGLSSWCSWELGEAYKGNKDFFKVVVAGIINNHPIIDNDFKELEYVKNGTIYTR